MWLIFNIFRTFLETNWSSFSQCIAQYEGEVLRTRIKWNILLNGKVSQFLSLLPKNGQHSHCKCIHIQRLQSSSSKSKARRLQPVKSTLCKKGSFNSEPPAAPRIPSTATTTIFGLPKSNHHMPQQISQHEITFGQRKKMTKIEEKNDSYEWMNECLGSEK